MRVTEVKALADAIREQVGKVVIGQATTVDLVMTALFCGGHILLEGVPGTAKTLLARAFGATLDLKFGRIQFTPDLMPGDILGTNQFNFQTSTFSVSRGPIFCDLLLADEINRTPPKTQAALLEAMQERSVTLDGASHRLSERFMVVATENPIEQQGTYPLPEAQLDRFLFKHVLAYPDEAEERAIVKGTGATVRMPDPGEFGLTKVADAAILGEAIACVALAQVGEPIVNYIVEIVRTTRSTAEISIGASPRCAAMLAAASRARAILEGRDYVIPDDVKALALPTLRHRVILSPVAEIDGRRVDEVISALVERIEAPR